MTAGPRVFTGEATDPIWSDHAACRGIPPNVFCVDNNSQQLDIDSARNICNSCPVRIDCLEHALANQEHGMMWGGLTDNERSKYQTAVRNRARRARQGQTELFEVV